ncbi:uncharacterized protein LOC117180692 [Belonocnema kinseyi]|uniref:uncharacterized protein LOC117180692 n=1 Tax=Belonocnema kinseyi TaxID=2817044 RepID=UPI00143E00D0|nr:uncharacterized protein LOC117180692 [Belonocnema kinseyi]
MAADEKKEACFAFLRKLKSKGKYLIGFEESVTILQEEAATRGLEDEDISLIIDIVWKSELGATKCVSLIKCMIPKRKVSDSVVKDMITWCVTSIDNTPVTVIAITLQWIVGLWEYDLADRKIINMFYEHFFVTLLHKEKVEVHLARLIYELTKPEDVTRRAVIRLLTHHKTYKKPQKHLNALLSLFKSYKPELVPEKIPAVGIGSTWKPIPDQLRLGFEDAKSRAFVHEARQRTQENFKWTVAPSSKTGKSKEPVLPSVGYFHMGSSIYKEKDTKSIFDLSNIEELGKYHTSVELPCNATSLLTNMAGYHLLMFADFEYQNRFSYNLYNMLRRAFLIEPGMYSREELDKLLDMTYDFLCYVQHGIPVVSRFLDEYLACGTGEHHPKLLALLQWTSLSTSGRARHAVINKKKCFYIPVRKSLVLQPSKVKNPFSTRHQGNAIFLKTLSNKAVEDLPINYLDAMLSLNHHYAVLPYKHTLNMTDLQIRTKEDMYCVADQYFPQVSDFLKTMGVRKDFIDE